MGVYPTLDNLQDVIDLAHSMLPIAKPNEMTAILFTYHNTLLRVQREHHYNQLSDSQTVSA
jgi:hypothetical protein